MNKKSFIDLKIDEIREHEQSSIENALIKQKLKEIGHHRGIEEKRDKEIYDQFLKHAEEGKKHNKNKFRMEYIDKLNLPGDILILLGKKNIGKTYAIHKLFEECIKEDRGIVMIRSNSNEIRRALIPLFDEPHSKVKIICSHGDVYKIVVKPDPLTGNNVRAKDLKQVGFCCSLSTITSFQGASYDKVKYVIGDECISDGERLKHTPMTIEAFERGASSFKRMKPDFKVIIMGNLLKKASQMDGDPVLAHFGINVRNNCKGIESTGSHSANVLYINTKEHFEGIEAQRIIGGVNQLAGENLLTNTMTESGIKTVSEKDFLHAQPLRTLVFMFDGNLMTIQVHKYGYTNELSYLIIKVTLGFYPKLIFTPGAIYTVEPPIANSFSHVCQLIEKEDGDDMLEELNDYTSAFRVLYADGTTEVWFNRIMKHLVVEVDTKKKGKGAK